MQWMWPPGLNIATFNVGIALGSVVGGFVVKHLPVDAHLDWCALIVLLPMASPTSAKREAKLALAV